MFLCNPVRLGGLRRSIVNTQYGPSLVHVMDWYWDLNANKQVCYTTKGLEYMRYDPRTQEYSFPDFSKMSFEGEHGLFGDLEALATIGIGSGHIPLEHRMGI